jgi:hypothetical protein
MRPLPIRIHGVLGTGASLPSTLPYVKAGVDISSDEGCVTCQEEN